MYKLYIAKDYKSYPLGVCLALNKDVANAYFMGKYSSEVQDIEEIDIETFKYALGELPCFNILSTTKRTDTNGKYFRVVDIR